MAKVVGYDSSVVRRFVCTECGAIVEYVPTEVIKTDRTDEGVRIEEVKCPRCGHDHGENTLFDVARGTLTPSQQAKVNEQFANYAKQKPHLYGGCDEISALREQVERLEALVVMRCDLEVPPQFSQGLQSHEVLEPVTAEHCQWFVAEIEKLRKERNEYKSGFEAAASKYRNLKLQMQEIINVC